MPKTTQANLCRITHKSFGKNNPFNVIKEGLLGKISLTTKSFLYHLNNVETFPISCPGDVLIYGEMYKTRLSSERKVLNKKNLTYSPEVRDEYYSMSRFVIFTDLSIIFTSNYRLRDDEFIENFIKLYQLNAKELFSQIEIHYRKEDFNIFTKIQSFARLIEVELINIRKSNPTPKPTFEKIEALLDRERTDVLNAKFKSESTDGLARDPDCHIMSGISIADSGYGDSIIIGQNQDGDFEKIRLKDKAIRKRILDVLPELKQEFVQMIAKVFGKYISSEDDLVHD